MRRYFVIISAIVLALVLPVAGVFAGGGQEDQQEDSQETAAPAPTESDTGSEEATMIDLTDQEKFVATVNGVGILRSDYELAIDRTKQQMAMQGQSISEDQIPQLQQNILDQMVAEELLYQDGIASGLEAEQESVDQQMDSIKSQFETDEQFEAALEQNQTTVEQLRADIQRNLVVQKAVAEATADVEPVGDDEIKTFYDENPSAFERGDQVAARHILISTEGLESESEIESARERAEEVRRQLLDGADFAELAKEKSEGPSASRGGDLGTFPRGQMVGPFEEAAFSLSEGEISEVVETRFGFHVIQVTEKINAGTMPLDDVRENIRQYLAQQKQSSILETYISELRENANVALNEEL
jgi:peptidyl-prolyl cis-trans isomerase C